MNNRDLVLLKTIIDTIDEIDGYLQKMYCDDFEIFDRNTMLKRAVAMCLISISEMVDTITDDFKKSHSQINYNRFKTLRNIAAHKYGAVNFEIVWEIIHKNLPVYKEEFVKILNE
jgi:uncharacterized protein with HEPN domain